MSYQLCKEFPAFTPFAIDLEPYHRVIRLYADVRRLQIRESHDKTNTNAPTVIRRRAGDNWF